MPSTASGIISTQSSKYVTSVQYTSGGTATGVITATATGDANIQGSTISLTGSFDTTSGHVTWTCSGTISDKYKQSSCK
jgi:type IV pilus assembly protein PilA